MDKNYYTEYFELERSHWWFLARKEILATQVSKLFGSNQSIRILNIGAATGASSQMLQAFGEVTSVEYEKDCIAFFYSLQTHLLGRVLLAEQRAGCGQGAHAVAVRVF